MSSFYLVPKLGLGTPLLAKLSLATIFVPKYNLGTSGKTLLYGKERIVPLVISSVAFVAFTTLLVQGRIGEASYCFLVAATVLLGLVLHGFGRLQELDLKNLRVVLRELQETKQELFVREEKLKAMAVPLAQIIALTGASEGRMGSRESWAVKRQWYKQKLQALIDALEFNSTESSETQKYVQKYEEIDRLLGDREALKTTDPDYKEVTAKLNSLSDELREMMKVDLGKSTV